MCRPREALQRSSCYISGFLELSESSQPVHSADRVWLGSLGWGVPQMGISDEDSNQGTAAGRWHKNHSFLLCIVEVKTLRGDGALWPTGRGD